MTHNQVNSWVCATIPMAGTVTYDCIPEVQIPTTNDPASCIWMYCPLNDKDNANRKKNTKTRTKTKTMQTERKHKEEGKNKDKNISPYNARAPCIWMFPDHPHNTNSLSVNSGCHSECLHQNSKSQCQKLSPWFLAGKLNGAWSVTEARKCSEVFEPLGCIASVWTPLHSFLMSQIIMQA